MYQYPEVILIAEVLALRSIIKERSVGNHLMLVQIACYPIMDLCVSNNNREEVETRYDINSDDSDGKTDKNRENPSA